MKREIFDMDIGGFPLQLPSSTGRSRRCIAIHQSRKESTDPIAELNQLGAEGWEFVETIDYEGGGTKYLVFKRPAQSSEGA